jgi:putative DNA primase/helicase
MIDSLLQKRNNNSSAALADLADLKGKRLIITSEVEQGAKLAEAQVKQLTGMARYKACRKYENPTEFSPTWKIFMDTNYRPLVRGRDAGIWNRLKVINFRVSIPKEEIDKHFLSKLKREGAGLLNWAVRGCLDWQRNGLQEPGTVQDAVLGWKAESDQFKGFFDLVCELNPMLSCPVPALRKAFEKFKHDKKLDLPYHQFTAELKTGSQ